ncbi:hypothetical protein ACHAXT_003682 [Thalassiosira profunda]
MPSSGGYSSGRSLSSGLSSRSRSLTPLGVGGGGFGGGGGRPVTSIGGGRSVMGGRSLMTASGSRSAVLPSGSRSVVRPMTGLAQNRTATPNRVVESAAYYQTMLQSKIEAILAETERLRSEAALADCESEPRRALDRKHREMATSVADLEAQLADFNLAREHARSGAGIEEIQRATSALVRGNKTIEAEVDKVFFSRKETEEELKRVQSETKAIQDTVEAKLLGGEDGDEEVHDYRSIVKDIETVVVETKRQEDDVVLLKHKLKTLGSEYAAEKKRVEELKHQLDCVEDEVQLAQMTAGDDEAFLLAKAGDFHDQTKRLEDESSQKKQEISVLHEIGRELRSDLRSISSGGHERLVRKEQKVKRFLDNFPDKKAALAAERTQLEASIESLRNDTRQADEMAATGLPSVEEMQLMREEAAFTGKQLDANQETMALLKRQKEARAEELNSINALDERIRDEMEELARQTVVLRNEMEKYQNLDGLREESDATRERLMEAKDSLRWGIQLLEDLLDEAPAALERSPKWREFVLVKSKLRSQKEDGSRETAAEYAKSKAECLRLVEEINQALILSQ